MNLENIYIINKKAFDETMSDNKLDDSNVETWDQYAFISIIDYTADDLDYYSQLFRCTKEHYFERDHANVLNLEFDDCEYEIQGKVFDVKMAEKVIEFLDNLPETVSTIIIHCMAGISRSAGIGEFIVNYFNFDYKKFKKTNPQIQPNIRVRRLLNNIAFRKNYN